MFDPLIILFVLTIVLRDSVQGLPAGPQLPGVWLGVFAIGGVLAIVALAYTLMAASLKRFDRTGSAHAGRSVFRIASLSKLALSLHWAACMLWLDWLGVVRSAVGGNLILIDEALAVLPFLLGLFLLYGVPYGIQQRFREASLTRWLDMGEPVPAAESFGSYLWGAIRHRAGIILFPVVVLTTSAELIDFLFRRFRQQSPGFAASEWSDFAQPLIQFAIVLVVLCVMPLALRFIWKTSSLQPCQTRTRLETMCREQGVRIRDILVWHPGSGMLNGALIGVIPRMRYILLTDALIERLPAVQLEAVMAHEIAHARRHHLPWMLGSVVALVTVCTAAIWLLARPFLLRVTDYNDHIFWSDVVSGASLIVALVVAFLAFGYISRRFERQADSFAAQHLSGVRFRKGIKEPTDRCRIITAPAVLAMQRALGAVAAHAGMPPERFSYRHGSIASRQRSLARLVCKPALNLPIDRTIRNIKLGTLVMLLMAAVLTVIQVDAERRDHQAAQRQALEEWVEQSQVRRWLQPLSERLP